MGQFTDFSQRKKDALKEKVTDTFPSENGKQYNADGELPQAAVILQDVLERLLNEIPQISDE